MPKQLLYEGLAVNPSSKKLSDLEPNFALKVQKTLDDCTKYGITMIPYFTIRSPIDQAKLWRQGRPASEIQSMIDSLREMKMDFLAWCLDSVGPQHGAWVTNAVPGYSFHQLGLAIDCYWLLNKRAEWEKLDGYYLYKIIGEYYGLTHGVSLGIKDYPHIQGPSEGSPAYLYSTKRLEEIIKEKWLVAI